MKNTPYQSGELDKKIKILRDIDLPDGTGGYNTTRVATHAGEFVWAKLTPGKPDQRLIDDSLRVVEDITITVRRGVDVMEGDLVEFKGALFVVRAIPTANDRHLFFDFVVERGVNV